MRIQDCCQAQFQKRCDLCCNGKRLEPTDLGCLPSFCASQAQTLSEGSLSLLTELYCHFCSFYQHHVPTGTCIEAPEEPNVLALSQEKSISLLTELNRFFLFRSATHIASLRDCPEHRTATQKCNLARDSAPEEPDVLAFDTEKTTELQRSGIFPSNRQTAWCSIQKGKRDVKGALGRMCERSPGGVGERRNGRMREWVMEGGGGRREWGKKGMGEDQVVRELNSRTPRISPRSSGV
jgi:hypothetical protein